MKATLAEEERIIRLIDEVLASEPDRLEAEEQVLARYAPLLDAAMATSKAAIDEWLLHIRQELKKD